MPSVFEEIKFKLRSGEILPKLIIINVIVFLVINLGLVFSDLLRIDSSFFNQLVTCLSVPASLPVLLRQPWSIVTYEFTNQDILHILFNMLWLYWMGKIFVEYLGAKKLLSVYILGGICGALMYILFFNLFPLFTGSVNASYALGASGSVLAITLAVATLLPDYTIFLLLIGPVKMKWIAAFTILLDLLSISGSNAGGHIAHLGGALFGFFYIRQLKNGNDIGKWLENLLFFISNLFSRKAKMRVAYSKSSKTKSQNKKPEPDQETIDLILDKISKSGYTSLTSEEKELLFKASKKT